MTECKSSKVNKHLKYFRNSEYEIIFDLQTGFEMMQGINGHEDPFKLELPSLLDIGVMGHCKNNCVICYQGEKEEPNMKLEDFKSIIDQAKLHTNQVALGGRGDPNHHENFKEIVEYCIANHVIPNYTTSGIGLTKEQVEISKMCGAVAVSDYEQPHTYEALNMFIDAGIKTNIHMVFTRAAYSKILTILYGYNVWQKKSMKIGKISLFDVEKLNAVIFLLFKPQGRARGFDELRPTDQQIESFAGLSLQSKASFKIGMDSCLVNHVLKYTKPTELQRMSMDTCEGARMSAYITPDMKFVPCSFCDHEEKGVSLRKRTLQDAWNRAQSFKSFRTALRKKPNICPAGF